MGEGKDWLNFEEWLESSRVWYGSQQMQQEGGERERVAEIKQVWFDPQQVQQVVDVIPAGIQRFTLARCQCSRVRICKHFKEPRNRFLAWRAGTTPYLS